MMALYLANPEEPGGDRKLELLKNKEGQLGRFTIHFDGAHQRFCEAGATPVKEEPYPQQELTAERIGVAASTIGNYERGTSFPNVPVLRRIEEVYGVAYENLVFQTAAPDPSQP